MRYYRGRFPGAEVWLGGIYASLLPDHASLSGADVVWRGIFPEAEDLMPAYDLVPGWRATILFASRGCVRRCPFCAVPDPIPPPRAGDPGDPRGGVSSVTPF